MSKHTPGPWVVDYLGTIGHIKSVPRDDQGRVSSRTPTVARYDVTTPSLTPDDKAANAALIAAAPEMAQCLHEAIQYLEQIRITAARLGQNVGLEDIIDDCKEVLTKATGEQP